MTSVIVVDDDREIRQTLARDLASRGYDVRDASGVDEALTVLSERPCDVLVTDLRMHGRDGLDLLLELRTLAPATRPILMSAYATARDYKKATELGAVQVLCKPFTSSELIEAIEQAVACEDGFHGNVHGLTLTDILQMFHYSRKSITLRLGGPTPGEVHLRDGEIIHAACGDLVGEKALLRILALPSGSMTSGPPRTDQEPTIRRSFQSLLLDVLRQLDEQGGCTNEVDPLEALGQSLPGAEPAATPAAPSSSEIGEACRHIVEHVDGALACGVVDVDTGGIMGMHNASPCASTLNEAVAAAAMELFRGDNVQRIEQLVRSHRGIAEDGAHYFREVQICSKHTLHFAKALGGGKAVLVLVCNRIVNPGMGWAQLRAHMSRVEPFVAE